MATRPDNVVQPSPSRGETAPRKPEERCFHAYMCPGQDSTVPLTPSSVMRKLDEIRPRGFTAGGGWSCSKQHATMMNLQDDRYGEEERWQSGTEMRGRRRQEKLQAEISDRRRQEKQQCIATRDKRSEDLYRSSLAQPRNSLFLYSTGCTVSRSVGSSALSNSGRIKETRRRRSRGRRGRRGTRLSLARRCCRPSNLPHSTYSTSCISPPSPLSQEDHERFVANKPSFPIRHAAPRTHPHRRRDQHDGHRPRGHVALDRTETRNGLFRARHET